MKVAFITRTSFGVLGGAGSYFIPSHTARHAEVLVLSPFQKNSREPVIHHDEGLAVHDVGGEDDMDVVANVVRELETFQPDIVHIFHNKLCFEYAKALKKSLPRTPRVLDFRSPPIMAVAKQRRRARWCYFRAHLLCDHVFTHSLKTMRYNLPLRLKRVTETPPGVELEGVNRREASSATPRRFLYVGSVAKVRQLDVMIDAFGLFADRVEAPVHLTLVGGGNAVEELSSRVAQSDALRGRVELLGPKRQREVYDMMAAYDVGLAYVPVEKYATAPSLKSVEYSAADLPFLASDTPGHRDYNRRFGFQFRLVKNTPEDWADALLSAYNGGIPESEVVANRNAVQAFDWGRIVEQALMPVYHRLLSRRR